MLSSLANSLSGASPSELALSAALAVLFAALGYRMSARHRALRGVTPWRVPSIAWAILCLFLTFIGLAIEIFAELTTRSPYSAAMKVEPPPSSAPARHERYGPPSTPAVSYDAPSGVYPPAVEPSLVDAAHDTLGSTESGEGAAPGLAPPPADAQGRSAGFGWYPDPLARHELRYFDGKHWNEHVVDDRTVSTDPL